MITHGHTRNDTDTPEYRSWRSMMGRCLTPSDQKYPKYGARGICICERWLRFENFLADMGARPERTTLDRINNDGNYEPDNCRWASGKQQQRNKTNSRLVQIDGVFRPLADVIEERGLNYGTIVSRVKRGWTPERAITQSVKSSANTSGFRGVHFRKDRQTWLATISVNGKPRKLGTFPTPTQAAQAYEAARLVLRGAA